jgi:hypothetical protein
MALSRGVKIALGCGTALVLSVVVVVVAVFGVAWWGIGKAQKVAEQFEADQKGVDEALQKANANPFTAPSDGVIQEDRLLRFLAVRKALHDEVYLKHKDMIESQAQKKDPDLSALAQLPFIIAELRASKARALAAHGMSESEFSWLFGTVYSSLLIASGGEDGKRVAEMARTGSHEVAEQAERALAAAEANPNTPPELKAQLREAVDRARLSAAVADEGGRRVDIPPANIALFEKHRDEILKYTMGGLELIPF